MKNFLIRFSTSLVLLFLMLSWNGCDKFNSLPLNIPFTLPFHVEGSAPTLTANASYCLGTASQTYNEYKDKINSLRFIEAAYRTTSVIPADLSGNINVTLEDGDGNVLFSYDIPGATPADYMSPNSPYILQLNQSQIDFMNTYLNNLLSEGACFNATITVSNIAGQAPYTIEGAVDMVIEADTEL